MNPKNYERDCRNEAKRKLKQMECCQNRKRKSRRSKKISEEQIRINELESVIPKYLNQQEKSAIYTEFENSASEIKHSQCPCCHKIGLNVKIVAHGLCSDCVKYKDPNYLLDAGALPIWHENGIPQCHIPPELSMLTMAEMMLIQLNSPFIPLQHIKHGIFGLSGHVCSFEQDVEEFVNRLPRHKNDVTMLKVLKVMRAELGSNDKQNDSEVIETFKVNKKHVGNALRWLKKHNEEYKNIDIDMSALDWLDGNEGNMDVLNVEVPDIATREDKRSPSKEDDLGPNPSFTRTLELEGSHIKTFGYVDDCARAELSPQDRQIHNELLQEIDKAVEKSESKQEISVRWPNSGPVPINEFTTQKLFVRAYPWLFPGGIGDVQDFPGGSVKQWGKNLLYYEDGRFSKDKFFCFFALNYITRQRNASSGNWFIKEFNKGGPETLEELKESIAKGDSSFVNRLTYYNKSIKGSSPFWFSKRQELYTWINHHVEQGHGAPNYFITLSCCEHYWADIIQLLKERLNLAGEDSSSCYVGSPKLSQILNDYAIVVQEYFQRRVELWLETVGKKILDIAHYYIRYEFAPGRGQIHAHILAIIKNTTILKLLYHDKQISRERRDQRLADWAEKTLGLTASLDQEFPQVDILPNESPCAIRFRDIGKDDLTIRKDNHQLMQFCQMHQCSSGFCLKPDRNKKSRLVCKCGAGSPATKGSTDTPGFPLRDKAEVVREQGKHLKLHMPRNHSRLNQTSQVMLQSWRGNCDIQILIYDSDPDHPNIKEISRVTDYVVAYNTKGNSTWMEEITTSKNLIMNADSITEDSMDLKRVCKQIMNKAATRRLISKQEASVLLGDLPLTKCSELIEIVSISQSKKITIHSNSPETKFINIYAKREPQYHHLSLHQYFSVYRQIIQKKAPSIPHYVGVNGYPCFPPSQAYARHVLICYKPWTTYPDQPNWQQEFHEFINSSNCPKSARLACDRVMQRHYDGTKFVDLKATSVDHSDNPISKEDQKILLLSGMGVKEHKDFNTDVLDMIDRGENYEWDKKPMPRTPCKLEENIPPEDWLWTKIKQQEEEHNKLLDIPKKDDGTDYEIQDLYPDQQLVCYKIIQKLQEFMECKDLSTFQPLRCTLVGQGGTGKTVLLNTITSVIRRLFSNSNVVKVAAPTGVAAYNVGGETLHRLTCRGIGGQYQANTLKEKELDRLMARFSELLVLIIDERSLMSSSEFGTTSQIITETVYEGGMQQSNKNFGGIPVVIIAGDDCQLASMAQGAIQCLSRNDGGKMTEKGRQCFKECAKTVFELSTSRRLSDKKKKDKEIMEAVRDGESIKDEHLKKLQSLHLDNMLKLHGPEVVQYIKSKAIYLFWTNDKRIQHNLNMLATLNNSNNPTALLKTRSTSTKHTRGVNSHFKGDFPGTAMLCKGAKVAIQGCNFQPLWGLHNGACGEIIEMIFSSGESPNKNNLPKYIVCNFPLYRGPVWDQNNPTVRMISWNFKPGLKYHTDFHSLEFQTWF